MKRYRHLNSPCCRTHGWLAEKYDGEWMRFEDHSAARSADQATIADLSAKCAQLHERLARSEAIAWNPIETAPHGEPGWSVGSREPSEYFIALTAPKYSSVRMPRVVRRIYDQSFAFADADRDTQYVDDYFSHWIAIPDINALAEADGGQKEGA